MLLVFRFLSFNVASRDMMVSVILSPFSLLNVLDIFLWTTNSLTPLSALLLVGSISGGVRI